MSLRSNHGFEYLCQAELKSRQQNQGYINILLDILKVIEALYCMSIMVAIKVEHYITIQRYRQSTKVIRFPKFILWCITGFDSNEISYNPENHNVMYERKVRKNEGRNAV